ncbi:MAG: hypothetical protein NTZ65_02165 [Candidatus Berkelbacteria bacterium]|nr:hypothetical protein [Candidatus Berkelbacteria bacterium]
MAEEETEEKVEKKEEKIGEVTHFFDKISVAIIKFAKPLKVGEKIKIKGATTDFEQTVDSMQLEHESIEAAEAGQELGIKTTEKTREGDEVYKAG